MEIFFGFLIFAFFVLTFAVTFYVNSREEKEEAREKRIDDVFDKLNQKAKPLEKHKVIQDLFVKSSIHVTKAGYI